MHFNGWKRPPERALQSQQLRYSPHRTPDPSRHYPSLQSACLDPRDPPALAPGGSPAVRARLAKVIFFKMGLLSALANRRELPSEKCLLTLPTPSHKGPGAVPSPGRQRRPRSAGGVELTLSPCNSNPKDYFSEILRSRKETDLLPGTAGKGDPKPPQGGVRWRSAGIAPLPPPHPLPPHKGCQPGPSSAPSPGQLLALREHGRGQGRAPRVARARAWQRAGRFWGAWGTPAGSPCPGSSRWQQKVPGC